jgi:hypothetical protein
MVDHEDKKLVLKCAGAEQAAMNVGSRAGTGQGVEDDVGALEHEYPRAFRERAVVADHDATAELAGWGVEVPDRELGAVAPAAAGFIPIDMDLAHDAHEVAARREDRHGVTELGL